MEKELKLSPKERELLEPFFETDVYQKALKPVLERWGNAIARVSAEQADWDLVLVNRGKLQAIRTLHKQVEEWHKPKKSSRETK